MTSSRSSQARTKTELLELNGSELLNVTISCAKRLVRFPIEVLVPTEESELS